MILYRNKMELINKILIVLNIKACWPSLFLFLLFSSLFFTIQVTFYMYCPCYFFNW